MPTSRNPLALAVMVSLLERPMHPYEIATTLRQRDKHRGVRLNYGALYSVVESLSKRRLIEPKETERAGRLPERTIYQLTEAGRADANGWLADLLSTPTSEYPEFVAALSFMAALAPQQVVELLNERLRHLATEQGQATARRVWVRERGLPRLLWVEDEYRDRMRAAEIDFVRSLIDDIESGRLQGTDWWRNAHERGFDRTPPPFDPELLRGALNSGERK